MTVEMMFNEIKKIPASRQYDCASGKLVECVRNSIPLMLRNARYVDSIDKCVEVSMMQYTVLSAMLENDQFLAHLCPDLDGEDAFRQVAPKEYEEVLRIIYDKTK